MTRVQLSFLTLLTAALVVGVPAGGGAQISVSLPDLAGDVGELVDIPITTGDLTGQEVTGYFFTIAYDPDVMGFTGVTAEGTLSAGMTILANTDLPGELRVAASQVEPLSGSGVLLELKGRYVGRGDSPLRWGEFAFNEGSPPATAVDGSAAVRIGLETGIGAFLPTISGLVGEKPLLPVEIEDLTGQGVFSYLFTITYNPDVLRFRGVSTSGTLSEGMSVQLNATVPGRVTVAASSETALEGTGSLIDLEVEYVNGGTSPLRWGAFVFNEHDPAPNPTDGQVKVDGEIVFNEIYSGPSPTVDWVEMLVVADHLDLRGYQVRSLAGEGFAFADDPLWEDLRRGTLILVGGNDAPLADDADPGDFVLSVRNDPFAPGSLTGGLLDIQGDADVVQILRPSEEIAFAALWGGVGPVAEFHVDLGPDPLSPEANIAFQGGGLAGVTEATEWGRVEGPAGTPRRGNSSLNQEWLSDLRGGAEVLSDIDIGELEMVLPAVSGQVGRTTLAPVQVRGLAGLEVFSYFFTVEYDPEIVDIIGVSVAGTLSENMSVAANSEVPGQVTVAASSISFLEGTGSLIDLEVEYTGPGTTALTWAGLQINEGEPRALAVDGRAVARVGAADGIGLTLPETTGSVGQTVSWPIRIDDLSGRGVEAYLFAIAYDARVVNISGISTAGTLSADMTIEANTGVPGRVTVAASSVAPLAGSGVLLELQAEYVGRGTTALTWTNFTFNEGDVEAEPVDGSLVVENDPLTAVDDEIEVQEDTPTPLLVLGNDDDPDGDPLVISGVGEPEQGTVVIAPDGTSLTYTPPADYSGPDSFTYEASDGIGDADTASVTIAVTPVNDPPVGVDNQTTTLQDAALTIFVLANDLDVDGDRLAIDSVTQPANGTAAIDPGNISVTYTPNPGFKGRDSFTYTLVDGNGGTAGASVVVEVIRTNDAPVAVDDAVETEEDTPVVVQVLDGDTDADGDELTVIEVGDPANGTVALDEASGAVTYAPAEDFNGEDRFTYTISDPKGATATGTVTVTVIPVNDLPMATDDAAVTIEDQAVAVAVLANDSDVEEDSLSVAEVSEPANGTAAVEADGATVTYTPATDFHGEDSFTYTVDDGAGGTATGTVTVTVTPVNDAPVAVDDTGTTDEDAPVVLDLLANEVDVDGDALKITTVTEPTNGAVEIAADSASVTYMPVADFNGEDSFAYTVSDADGETSIGTVTVTVRTVNDAPVAIDDIGTTAEDAAVVIAVLANDSDADGETPLVTGVSDPANGAAVVGDDGATVTYTPAADFNGEDSFTYAISDVAGATATATVTVAVTPVNDAPVAVDDTGTTDQEVAAVVAVLVNDADVDGETPSLESVSQPQYGTAEIDAAGGTVTYTPETGFSGEDSFTYAIVDGSGASGAATVRITVNPEQIPPELVSSSPAAGETDLEVDPLNAAGLVFVFSEPIAAAGVQAVVQGDGQALDWTASWSAGDTQLTLRPVAGSELAAGAIYQVTLTQVLDLKGNNAGDISIAFETLSALPGDVNADAVIDVRDVILTLRLAVGLPVATPPAGHIEPTPYELRTADVNGDGTIDEADALLTLGAALDRIASKPILAQSGPATLRWGEMAEAGGELTVPVRVEGRGDAHAGRIDLRYSADALELLEVSAGSAGALMSVDDRLPGELGVSLVHLDGLAGSEGAVVLLRFRIDESLRAEGWLCLEGARLFDAGAGRMEVGREEAVLRLVPRRHALFPNVPNPFNPSTEIRFQLPAPGVVRLVVYDLLGRSVRVLENGHRGAGYHLVTWDGRDDAGRPAGSGIYLLRLESGDFAQVRKMTLMR